MLTLRKISRSRIIYRPNKLNEAIICKCIKRQLIIHKPYELYRQIRFIAIWRQWRFLSLWRITDQDQNQLLKNKLNLESCKEESERNPSFPLDIDQWRKHIKEIAEWTRKLEWIPCLRVKFKISFLPSALTLNTNTQRFYWVCTDSKPQDPNSWMNEDLEIALNIHLEAENKVEQLPQEKRHLMFNRVQRVKKEMWNQVQLSGPSA